MIIISRTSRKDLVRKQKAVINFVNRNDAYTSARTQEAIQDLQRWSVESGIFKDIKIDDDTGQPISKGCRWVSSFEKKSGRSSRYNS